MLVGGGGWHSRTLHARVAALAGRGLRALGRVDDARLAELVGAARAFAYPSLYEGFGLPPLEAMACGVPVVTSDVSSLPEVVGDAGLRVDPRDPRALAVALRRLVDEPELAARLGERGRERARGFTWRRAAAALEDVFREALG